MNTTRVLLSLGSNLEPRAERIETALVLLKQHALTEMIASHVYTTEPVGFRDQPDFLNVAVAGQTTLSAFELFKACKEIEHTMGRQHRKQWREREIDIDVILYGNVVVERDDLLIPHPRMSERRFVLAPASEIAGDMVDPRSQKTIAELLVECTDNSNISVLE
ncbi:MAG: 2-amino-4-hydroxy-6-hydroxymethyldihydropteridine diphosphokinase [bacterium]|nr:2-amino-4-hydroxy-6-hydroxymethyldihydropteridine diphosphokinase [bacterium]